MTGRVEVGNDGKEGVGEKVNEDEPGSDLLGMPRPLKAMHASPFSVGFFHFDSSEK